MSQKKQKFYVVWEGREVGIFHSWDECKQQIDHFEGAKYKSFPTEQQAREAFCSSPFLYLGKKDAPAPAAATNSSLPRPITPSISVDAACAGNPGVMEYRGVDTASGREIFHQGPFPEGTNNIGEFLAIVHALALMEKKHIELPIYSDSVTGQSWVRHKQAKTKLAVNDKNRELLQIVQRAEQWLQTHTPHVPILKWRTEIWGEIPADFGRK